MKRRISILILSLFLISAAMGSIYLWVKGVEKHPFTTKSERIEFKVKSGDTLNGVIASLEEQKLLKNQYIVKWYIKRLNLNTKIKPGSYDLSNKITISEFVKDLNSGKYNENAIKVTIPEGYDEVHIAALLEEKGIISKEVFIEACKEYSVPDYVKKDSKRNYTLEGYLFPDTYEIIKGTQGKDI
ncbi:endolytic transglycosylase MltG, partial [Clostridium omnivorum]|uniref:endolytic transglycosylase MltG n=1 Tax=Clostridium omnivorum TaxID=1604902 RepID=UPI00222F9A3A